MKLNIFSILFSFNFIICDLFLVILTSLKKNINNLFFMI